jgi:hypothetical protein
MAFYPRSVAYNRLFKMISSTDHISLKTGAAPVVNLSKAGAAFGAAAGAVTEVASGWYKVALNTTDTGTAGDLAFYITGTGADDTDFCDQVYDPTVANIGINVVNWNNTVVATPATAGIPDVNAKNINNVATTSVTTINANQGTTQPLNFTGTAGSALVKSDMIDVAGAAVSTTSAQIGVNAVQINAVSTASVTTVSANQGTTQPVNFTGTAASALVKSDTVDIAGAAVSTSTAQIGVNAVNWAGGAIPAVNVTGVPLVDLKYTLGTISPATAGSVRADAVTGAVGSVTGSVGSVTGAVGSVTGNVGGNVTGSVGSVATGGIAAASFAAGAIDASAIAANAIGSSEIAAGAITAAKFAADAIDSTVLAASAATEISTAVFARAFSAAYGSLTFEQMIEVMASALAAKCSGMATTTGTFRNLGDTADVIVATIDANGNRTAVTLTP